MGPVCGRFTLASSRYEVAEQFEVGEITAPEMPPRYNVAPSQEVYAVTASQDGSHRVLSSFRWGLVPSWASDPSIGNRMINARSETAASKPSFRAAFVRRRCLVPANGYYEWQKPAAGAGRKVPYYFHRRDGLILAFAGLWESWNHADRAELRTCTILTTGANATNAPVHDRMPVIVEPDRWDLWLRPGPLDDRVCSEILAPASADVLVTATVGDRVNNPRNEGPDLITPADG